LSYPIETSQTNTFVSNISYVKEEFNYKKKIHTHYRMRVFLCKTHHWIAVQEKKIYYVSELQLANLLRSAELPSEGEIVKFIANKELGTAQIVKFTHNGYAGHIELRDFCSLVDVDKPAETTKILDSAPNDVLSDLTNLENEKNMRKSHMEEILADFAYQKSKVDSIDRRISGLPIVLSKRKKTAKKQPKLKKTRKEPELTKENQV
jgi:hypothetical protein